MNVNEEWIKYDIIITTTTITVGVDFTKNHFDFCLIINYKNGAIPRDLVQSSIRVRNFRENTYYLIQDNKLDISQSIPITTCPWECSKAF